MVFEVLQIQCMLLLKKDKTINEMLQWQGMLDLVTYVKQMLAWCCGGFLGLLISYLKEGPKFYEKYMNHNCPCKVCIWQKNQYGIFVLSIVDRPSGQQSSNM